MARTSSSSSDCASSKVEGKWAEGVSGLSINWASYANWDCIQQSPSPHRGCGPLGKLPLGPCRKVRPCVEHSTCHRLQYSVRRHAGHTYVAPFLPLFLKGG